MTDLTETERLIATAMGVSPEAYLARKAEGLQRQHKATRDERIAALRGLTHYVAPAVRTLLEAQIAQLETESDEEPTT